MVKKEPIEQLKALKEIAENTRALPEIMKILKQIHPDIDV